MRTWRPRKGPSPSSHGPGEEGIKPWYRVRLAGRRASSGTPEKLHSLQGAKLHAGQPGRTKPFQAMLREGRLPQEPPWTCTRACWRASLARCNHTACTFSQAAHPDKLHAGQGEERQKTGPCRPLHVVRPLQWETHGPPSRKGHIQSCLHQDSGTTTIHEAEKCSLGALCVCLEGRVLQKRSGATV